MTAATNGDFYKHDRRCGPVVRMNGEDLYAKYNADLVSITPSPGSIDLSYKRNTGRSSFTTYLSVDNNPTYDAMFYVGGANKMDMMLNINGLIAACKSGILYVDEDLACEYEAVLSSFSYEDTGIEWFSSVTLTFQAIRRFPLVTETVDDDSSITFENLGTVESGMRISVSTNGTITPFSIVINRGIEGAENQIDLDALTGNLTFVIDGIEGTVRENGVNAMLKTTLVNFPKVLPGDNTIEFKKNSVNAYVDATIEYYPTFAL